MFPGLLEQDAHGFFAGAFLAGAFFGGGPGRYSSITLLTVAIGRPALS